MLDVNGVGYLVRRRRARRGKGGDEMTVETYLHVREDALQLYGFADADERELFVQLLGVNGVGPKVALAIVSGSPPAELRRAIVREDTRALPGDPRHRQEDRPADRARAEGEARRATVDASAADAT